MSDEYITKKELQKALQSVYDSASKTSRDLQIDCSLKVDYIGYSVKADLCSELAGELGIDLTQWKWY